MPSINFEGIKKPKNLRLVKKPVLINSKAVSFDGVLKQQLKKTVYSQPIVKSHIIVGSILASDHKEHFFKKIYRQKKVPIFAAVLALLFAFGGGMWAALNTFKSSADSQPEILGEQTTALTQKQNYKVLLGNNSPLGPVNSVSNDVLFNMTIGQLENYLAEELKAPELKQAEILSLRKAKLKVYLKEKNSPLSEIVNTIAELKHWKLVLAISNSESSMGKRCYNNNCSGIGVDPTNPAWRNYKSKSEWAKDLDRLLNKSYKDWTLEKMNGVYNQPGSQNWILAAKQVLEDLQERGIE